MDEVYSPSEDSWMLEEYLLKEDLCGKKCLDFGCGSGIQAIAMLRAGAKEVLSVDVNDAALKAANTKVEEFLAETKKCGSQIPGQFLGAKKSEYFSTINEKFDFIAFNPPYVPSNGIKWRDLDGGENGRLVIDKFIGVVKNHLNCGGVVLLLVSSLNNVGDVCSELKKNGFKVNVASNKRLFFEELVLLRATLV